MKGKRLEDWTREDFLKLYKIIKRTPKGKWKNVTEAAQVFELSRPTIYEAIYFSQSQWGGAPPEKAKAIVPKVELQFYESQAWQKVKGHEYQQRIESTLKRAWEILGRIDPYTWSPEMVASLRKPIIEGKSNPLYNLVVKDIDEFHATQLRRAIRSMHKGERKDLLLDELEDVKGLAHGARLHWYLDDEDIPKLVRAIWHLDVLIYTLLGLTCGGRPISLAGKFADKRLTLTTDKIDEHRKTIMRWESKVAKWSFPKFQDWIMALIKNYTSKYGIPYGEKLFPKAQDYYSEKIREAGLSADIERFKPKGAGAYILRHTYATKAAEHGVSLEIIMFYGGWMDAGTIKDFYMAIPEEKIDREVLGMKKDTFMDWNTWINQFKPVFEDQFNVIIAKGEAKPEPKAEKKPEPEKPKVKRPITWEQVKASAQGKAKTEKGRRLIEWNRKMWKLHEEYPTLSYQDIKEKLRRG